MTSYQKIKFENEQLKGRLNVFKNALTVAETLPFIETDENGNIHLVQNIIVQRNKYIDELCAKELTLWVAENLDEKTIKHLLELKEKMKNEKIN